MDWLTMTRWSPYAVGVGIGLLSCAMFVLLDKPLGCSTAFARTSGMIERLLRGKKVLEKEYYKKFLPAVDWEVMLSAVVTGMIGVHLLRDLGLAQLHPKPGSVGMSVIGGLIFGVGFGLLGYCPGTVAGAIGNGYLDALLGGAVGMVIGAGLFAAVYPKLQAGILRKGEFGTITLPELLKVNAWVLVAPVALALVLLLWIIERAGL
jgi:uncharacterized protein